MITFVKAVNYRNLDTESGVAFGNLNILIGPNGSGKTNLVRLFRFLQATLLNSTEQQRGVTSFEDAISSFGGERFANIALKRPATVNLSFEFKLEEQYYHGYDLNIEVADTIKPSIKSEAFYRRHDSQSRNETPFYYYRVHNHQVGRGVVSVAGPGSGNPNSNSHNEKVENQPTNETAFVGLQRWLEENATFPIKDTLYFEGRSKVVDSLRLWAFYESSAMNLEAVRRYSPETGANVKRLGQDGQNLVEALHNLSEDHIEFEDALSDAFRELFPRTHRIRVRVLGRKTLQLEWYPNSDNKENCIYIDEMSDGTIRMLCWAAVLLSPERPSLIVMDEPESGVHPAWLKVLAGWIREAARHTQVIVSTHSPELLDYFTDALEAVKVFELASGDAMTTCIRNLKAEQLENDLNAGWKLGDLYRVGNVQVGGWPW